MDTDGRRLQRLADRADHLAHGSDPGRAFFDFFTELVHECRGGDSFGEVAPAAGSDANRPEHLVLIALARLLERAQRTGRVRPDVSAHELRAVIVGTGAALRHAGDGARALAIVVDGLRLA
ncbi:hypothetical protein Val02_81120 [Virgisporangium aliadipatigenens]|uniref:Transcriptional regulator SbtR-like C-terminal domain-containing protein n=1 Tax=Virgisporangium aliadipatigenens TaxID=741659 RepID=A0A8J3YTG4_9ACTN|nr:hypothetical protein [Virgisporangium aliadipatigenens]GIJ51226.1 hypothetical protein Val02_81120 [Virgisporangium aliadipatigenens]